MPSALARISQAYSGPTLIARLIALLDSEQEREAALSYLIGHIKSKTLNVSVLKQIESPLSEDSEIWIKKATSEQIRAIENADRQLYNSKLTLDPEKIRNTLWNMSRQLSEHLGDHKMSLIRLLEINELTSEVHDRLKLSIAVVSENIYSSHPNIVQHVRSEVVRVLSTKGTESFPTEVAILKGALAVVQILQMQFYEAAETLLSIGTFPDHPPLFYATDLARYMIVCVLASHSRQQLRQLLGNDDFKSALDLCPESKQAFYDLCNSQYRSFFRRFQHIAESYFIGDPYFRRHISEAAFESIQEVAFCIYISPYESVCLRRMSAAFDEPAEKIQAILVRLIHKGAIQAKIDTERQVLFTNVLKPQQNAFDACDRIAKRFLSLDTALSLRIAQLRHRIVVRSAKLT